MQQRVELERLGDEVGRALLDGLHGVLHRAEARDDDGDDVGVALDRRLEHLPAVEARQPQVGDDDVEGELRQTFERGLSAVGLDHVEPVVAEAFGNRLPQGPLVVYEEQMFLWVSHLVRLATF